MPETAVRSRGRRGESFTLLTPANHFASRLPSLKGVRLIKLVTPRLAPALFAEYLLDVPARGARCPLGPQYEHFLYGLGGGAGALSRGGARPLACGGSRLPPRRFRPRVRPPGRRPARMASRLGTTVPRPCSTKPFTAAASERGQEPL